jgi:sugar phosphate isomerase/epimerase
VEVRSRDTTRSASLSEPTSSAGTLGAVSSTSFSYGSSSAVRTRAASGHSITTAEVLACEELDSEQETEVDEPGGVAGEAEVKVVEERATEEEDKEKAKVMDRLAAIAAKLEKGKRLNFEEAVLLFNHKPIRAMKQLIANGFVRVPLAHSNHS